MVSDRKAAANAANAQLSTGPRTEEGKERSSQNAIKHGLTAKELVVREDEREEFEIFRVDFINNIAPEDVVEVVAVNQALHAAWNLRRLRRLEADLMVNGLDPLLDESSTKSLDRLLRYAVRAERSYFRAMDELRKLQTQRALWVVSQDVQACPRMGNMTAMAKRTHQVDDYFNKPLPKRYEENSDQNFVPLRR
jgi:hypothetical protein